jgi:hypothetical protein
MRNYFEDNYMPLIGCIVSVCLIITIIAASIWYQDYFNKNCLRSHTERYWTTITYCAAYARSGRCIFYSSYPEQEITQVCDQWRQS